MIVPVTLHLVIVPVIIPMNVCLHDLMLVRAVFVRTILRADQRWGYSRHRKSRQGEQCRFPKMLAHIAFLVQVDRRRMLVRRRTGGNSRRLTGCVGANLRLTGESTHPSRC